MENNMENQNYQPVSVGQWLVTLLLMIIPIVNIILLFVWAFGSNAPVSKSNWAKATLIWLAIVIALNIVFMVMFGAALSSM